MAITERPHAHGCCTTRPELATLVDRGTPPPPGPRRPVPRRARRRRTMADLPVLGRVVTMDPARPVAGAIAVADGRILAVGDAGELDGLRATGTEVLELGDHVAYPGFVEPHMHLWTTGLFRRWVDCSPLTHPTVEGVLDVLRAANAHPGPDGWVLGQLYDPSLFDGEPELTRDLLDQLVPEHPAVVMNASMHFAYANSQALAAAHITDDSPDPPGGFYERRDGRLTGALGELGAIMPMLRVVPHLGQDELARALVDIMHTAAGRGVTKIHECGTGGLFGVSELDLLHGLAADGRLPVRITASMLDNARRAIEESDLAPGAGDEVVRATSWKVIADGSNQGRSGYQREPYLGRDDRGHPNYSDDELRSTVRWAHDAGWQVLVHANGDAAIEQVVTAYEHALAGVEPHDHRHRIEHCSLPTDEHLARMASAGVSPSFLMNHVYYWGRAFRDRIIGAERAARLDPIASARRHGLRPSLHSDYNVTPIDPLRSVQTAVTRRMRDGGEVLNPGERDTVEAAMRAITIDAAWQTHTDDVVGSLEVGKLADLVVLSDDPRAVDPDAIAGIEVVETRLAGSRTA